MTIPRRQGGKVRKLPNSRWQALVNIDGTYESKGTFATEREALDAMRIEVVEADQGSFLTRLVYSLFEEFARGEVGLKDVRMRTRKGYESLLNTTLLPFFGKRRLDQITIGDVKIWWSMHSEQPVNRRNGYFLLRSIMSAAVDEQHIMPSPCRIKGAGKDVAKRRSTWAPKDYETVLQHVASSARPALEMLFASHCRLGEVIALNASDYDNAIGTVHVTKSDTGATKTGQEKHIHLLERGKRAMSAYLIEHPRIGDAPLFIGEKGGRLPRASLRKAWLNACAFAGREDFHLQDRKSVV